MPVFDLKPRRTRARIQSGLLDLLVIDPLNFYAFPHPPPASATAVELGVIAWVSHAADSLAQMAVNDVLEEIDAAGQPTGLKLFVYELARDSVSVVASCIQLGSDALFRERVGAADLPIFVFWFYPASSGFAADILGDQRIACRLRRPADVTAGDLLYNSSTGERWYVYEILNQQSTKVAWCLKVSGAPLDRTRYGSADLTLHPAWVYVLRAGTRKAVITSGQEVGISAEMRVRSSADVKPGDFLYAAARRQRFNVQQVIPESSTQLALCLQVPIFIPDEFDNAALEGFWTPRLNSGSLSASANPGVIELTPPNPGAQVASNGLFIYQTLSGDFDVFCRLAVTNNLGANQSQSGYLGARVVGAPDGVYIGMRGRNSASAIIRIDQYGAAAQSETLDAGPINFVRLKRTGVVLHTYYSRNGATNVPSAENNWVELEPSENVVTSDLPLEVGFGCYINVAPGANRTQFYFVRNFVPS